jgi:phosphatidylglycerophosphate synthase
VVKEVSELDSLDTTGSAVDARHRSARSVRIKARDGWWTVLVVDPIAVPLVSRCGNVPWITPNRLTGLSAALAVGAGAAFAAQQFIVGALLYQASFVVDCMDGKLAALHGTPNSLGRFFDVAADSVRFVAAIVGLAYGVASSESISASQLAIFALYASLRSAVLMVGDARPVKREPTMIDVAPTALSVLRIGRQRLGKPGSTVDSEMLAFTLGPALGFPLLGLAAAAFLNAVQMLLVVVTTARSRNGF